MDVYQRAVSRAVKIFMSDHRRSADSMARALGITRGAFYAKSSNQRNWTLENIAVLNDLGVRLPALSTGRKQGK